MLMCELREIDVNLPIVVGVLVFTPGGTRAFSTLVDIVYKFYKNIFAGYYNMQ